MSTALIEALREDVPPDTCLADPKGQVIKFIGEQGSPFLEFKQQPPREHLDPLLVLTQQTGSVRLAKKLLGLGVTHRGAAFQIHILEQLTLKRLEDFY